MNSILFPDIDEDLEILESDTVDNNNNDSFNLIKSYENKLKASESKIEELVDIVENLRWYVGLMDNFKSVL